MPAEIGHMPALTMPSDLGCDDKPSVAIMQAILNPTDHQMRHFRVFLLLALTIASLAIMLTEVAGWLFA